jgi:hypothetical protein
VVELQLNDHFQFHASSTFSTGTPNQLFKILEATQNRRNIEVTDRMGNYHRLDASLVFHTSSDEMGLEAKLFIFNQ